MEHGADQDSHYGERFVRWQSYARQQLTVAVAGFAFSAQRLASAAKNATYEILLGWKIAVAGFAAAVALVVWVQITRALDAAMTARKIRARQKNKSASDIEALDKKTKRLGAMTWWLFWLTVSALVIGGGSCFACLLLEPRY